MQGNHSIRNYAIAGAVIMPFLTLTEFFLWAAYGDMLPATVLLLFWLGLPFVAVFIKEARNGYWQALHFAAVFVGTGVLVVLGTWLLIAFVAFTFNSGSGAFQ